ncbi:MAG: extracellular solute-binding protein [Clostridia bacterium]|nr:extracellular solute-binding protein [Clostridia bacterium]
MLDLAEYNGSQISLPYTLSLYGIHYNTEIFDELGLEIPTTMDALIDVCAKLKEAGYDAFALPLGNNAAQMAERLISAFDGNSYVEFQAVADGELDIHDVKSLQALADFWLAVKPYSTEDALGMDNDSAHADFINRKAAMRLQGSWYLSTVKNADPDFPVGLFGIPSPVTNDVIIPVNIDTGFSVSTSTAHPEEAMKFVEFLSRPEVAQKYYAVDGNINMIKGVEYDKTEYMDVYNLVMDGKMSLTQINLWQQGTNVRSGIAAAVQELYADEDLEAFYQTCYDTIIENYE